MSNDKPIIPSSEKVPPAVKKGGMKPSLSEAGPTVLDPDEGIERQRGVGVADDDDEGGVSDPSRESPVSEVNDDEDDQEEAVAEATAKTQQPFRARQTGRQSERRRVPTSAKDLLEEDLLYRTQSATPRLRAQLTGKILFQVLSDSATNGGAFTPALPAAPGKSGVANKGVSGAQYLFDWSADQAKVAVLDCSVSEGDKPDCVIRATEKTLMQISSGELNPQIAMISEKIKVEGNLSLAIYVFNLIAPQPAW